MAPYQYPRQVLIWSLPTLAVLISLFWYKRRKSDPGGTKRGKTLEPVDSGSGSIVGGRSTAVHTDRVITAIEKALRDLETSQPIQEIVSVEEEAEEHSIETERQVVTNQVETTTSLPFVEQQEDKCKAFETHTESEDKKINCIHALQSADVDAVETISGKDNNQTIKKESVEDSIEDSPLAIVADATTTFVKQENKCIAFETHTESEDKKIDCVHSLQSGNLDAVVTVSGKDYNPTIKKESQSNFEDSIEDSPLEIVANATATFVKQESKCIAFETHTESEDKKVDCVHALQSGDLEAVETISGKDCSSTIENKSQSSCEDSSEERFKVEDMALECNRVAVEEKQQHGSIIEASDMHLEQKLASLGLEGSHNQEGGERDSANHSPADLMLASPSMSHFSDAQSEGSSDSGKGCSDVATPPPQTPAGGSSVAGDLVPSVYEFIIPQYMVGRLIGRHGAFLHDIRGKTHTNVFIKRHPDTPKLKICAIEGTQQDIDAALAMIRQKFPIRRFPALTLEKVSFVNIEPIPFCPLQPEQFQLQLIEGVNNDVILSSLITAGHFFLQQPTHPSYQSLCRLNLLMNSTYSSPDAPSLESPIKDAVCAAPAMGGWYRAQIVSINEDAKTVDVRFLDYGGFLSLEYSELRKIRGDFLMLPFQAVECLLANIIPAGGEDNEWCEEARIFVQSLTCGQILQAQIFDYTEQGVPLVFLYASCGTQVVLVNQELVARGYAELLTQTSTQQEECVIDACDRD